jgi:hypothetical protein
VLEDAVERQKNNGDGCCDRVGYRVTDAPSCLVSVMRSCRCSAAFCLFALSFAKPHDDRPGPPWPSRVQQASLSSADKCPAYLPEQDLFPLFLACMPQRSNARLPWWSANRAPKDSRSYSNAHKPDEANISHQRKYDAHRRTNDARCEDGQSLQAVL